MIGKVGAVFWFEWRRALTVPRMAWWMVLTLFPSFIVLMIRLAAVSDVPRDPWAIILFALVPMLVTMLGAFLWMAPAVSAELERKSWAYLAVRPRGAVAVLLGKYLAAVTWVLPAALIGLTLAMLIAAPGDWWRIWSTIARLTCLSAPAYAAAYLLLGVLFPNRAMVFAVAYSLILELIIAWIPAMINKLSVQYRLRGLFVDWTEMGVGDSRSFEAMAIIGDAPAWRHVTILVGYTLVLLLAAVLVVHLREFSTSDESEL